MTPHEMQTILRNHAAENSVAQNKLREALEHHTVAHANTLRTQTEALASSIAHESQRADARDQMSKQAMKALAEATASKIQLLAPREPTQVQQNLERARIELEAARPQPGLLHDGKMDAQLALMKKTASNMRPHPPATNHCWEESCQICMVRGKA